MKNIIALTIGLFAALAFATPAGAATCTGTATCRACSNCKYCGHCKGGGSCGVCASKKQKVSVTPVWPAQWRVAAR